MIPARPAPPPPLAAAIVLAVAGTVAAAVAIALLQAEGQVRFTLLGGMLLLSGFALCGNIRLGLLWGLVLTAPLALCKRFMIVPNMGGASALQIDATDVFWVPLLLLQIRELQLGHRQREDIIFPLALKWWGAWILLGGFSILLGPYRSIAGLELVRMVKLFGIGLVVANEITRRSQLRHLAAALMIGALLQSTFGITQYLLQRPIGLHALGEATAEDIDLLSRGTLQSKEFVFRISALMGHANFLATFLAAQIPLALAVLMTRAPLVMRGIAATTLAFGGIALMLTLSRTGWVAAATALSGVMALSVFHPRLRTHFQLGRLAIALGALALGIAFSGKIVARLTKSDAGAVDFRWELLDVAIAMGKANPVFGSGLNSFVFQMPPYTKYKTPEGVTDHFGPNWPVVHNVYALAWAEQGAPGLIAILGFAGSMLWMAFRNLFSRDEEAYAFSMGALMAVCAFLLDWLASFTLRNDNVSRIIFIVIGLMAALERARRAERTVARREATAGAVPPTPPPLPTGAPA